MKTTFQPLNRRRFIRAFAALGLLVGLLWVSNARAQTAEEHASHHPGQAGAAAPGAGPGPGGMGPPAGAGPPGGMGDMGKMMEGMGKAPPKELYPTLMALPELTKEQRQEVEQQAGKRMNSGSTIIAKSLESLNNGAQSGDYAAMEDAATHLREGVTQLESGIAARRALAEGRAPREVALAWFKREMNLSLGTAPAPHGLLGVTPFHLFTMVLLVAFALAMLAMYFFKMRRAAALFGRIEKDKGPPPPGSAPELAGGKPSSGDKPPSGNKPPSEDKPPASDKPPSADKPAAPAAKPAASADKLAAAADKLAAAAEKLATASDKPAEKPASDAPPKAP